MGRRKESKNKELYRAFNLTSAYNQTDRKYGLGKGDLTAQWIVVNIFSKPCAHCGKSGWQIMGCNRLDNSKPHTMDNVEPCCAKCNKKLPRKREKKGEDIPYKLFAESNKNKLLENIGIYNSIADAIEKICSYK